ncbi:hypothetical protein D3C86_2249840 [compost metagenome]
MPAAPVSCRISRITAINRPGLFKVATRNWIIIIKVMLVRIVNMINNPMLCTSSPNT